ncbi:sodium-independent sulfate anion transporter [Eurytemora carolleeae]|uniref:sodium-independent sulfate anion transporter n=1 Tax=Eurytemora carolleeae TaxID=1294199 RepID=UPI000C76A732|nr:sodium-independent sulfate anion transporter [Eurytemora carolleeae]|eukprot:XP_023344261.1 sodium-independent sulfate anion transporter-like [Eurytemora affinis]
MTKQEKAVNERSALLKQKMGRNAQKSDEKRGGEEGSFAPRKDSFEDGQNKGRFGSCSMDTCGNKTLKYLKKRLPFLSWITQYKALDLISDCIAGITVGLTVIPQGIAYAAVAGLEAQYGLYSAFMGCFVYCIFGTSKDITIGPTAIMALMTATHAQYGPDYAVLLAFLSGIIILACGLLQLGFLIDFISVPVIAGFTSAAAITIATGQVKALLGIKIDSHHKSHTHLGIVDPWIDVFTNIETTRYQDAILGIVCAIVLLSLRYLNRTSWFKTSDNPNPGLQTLFNKLPINVQHIVSKGVWFLCTARYLDNYRKYIPYIQEVEVNETCIWTITGNIQSGLPPFTPPPFSTVENNSTIPFMEMTKTLGSAIIVIPLIAILESVAIAKAFAGGKPVDASQEMVALGFCNIFGSFVRSMPTTGSFSRTAVNAASGVKSPLSGLFTGGLVILCLGVLIPYCAFIPKATLAAVIITAVIFSVEYHLVMPMWRSKKIDLLPAFVCFFVCVLYELEFGILAGVVVQMLFLIYAAARPKIAVNMRKIEGVDQEYLYICPDQGIIFPSVTYVRNLINKAALKQAGPEIPVVIDCSKINNVDFTAAEGFHAMIADMGKRNTEIYWLNPSPSAAHTLRVIAKDHFRVIYKESELIDETRSQTITPGLPSFSPLVDEEMGPDTNGL